MNTRSPVDLELTPRQGELADAALAVLARSGITALSFRVVATEARCSVGAVQKAFPTKEKMIIAAFTRLRHSAVPLPPGEPGRPTLQHWLVEFALCVLPLDAPRAAAQRQGDALGDYAANNPMIADAIASSDDHLRTLLSRLITRANHEGELPGNPDPDPTAWALLAVIQGAAAQLRYQPRTDADIRRLLDHAFQRLLD